MVYFSLAFGLGPNHARIYECLSLHLTNNNTSCSANMALTIKEIQKAKLSIQDQNGSPQAEIHWLPKCLANMKTLHAYM